MANRGQPVRHRGLIFAALVTVLAIAIVEFLACTALYIPAPTVLLAIVTYAAYAGGLVPGLLSALITSGYGFYFFSDRNHLLSYTDIAAARLIWFAVTCVVIATLVGLLRRREQVVTEDLHGSRDQLQAILEGVADGIAVQDASGRIVYVNDAAARTMGYASAVELLSAPVSQLLGRFKISDETGRPLDLESLPGRLALRGEPSSEILLRFQRLDAEEERWSVVKATPVLDERGKVQLAINIIQDVTDRRNAEEQVRESEERFRTMANVAPVLIWVSGEDASVTFCNTTWLEFTGRTLEQELGEGWADGVHPKDLPKCLNAYRVAFHARRPFTIEFRLRRHDGEYRWILDTGVPRFTPGGEFTGFIGSCIDITERKQVEEANRLLASIVESSSNAIIGKTLDGIIVSWNPAAERLYGYSEEEALGQPISMLAPPERRDEIPAILERIGRGERIDSFETVRLSKDRRRIDVSLTISPIVGPDSVPLGASAIARDISERKRAEEMRDLAVSEERQRMAREIHDSVAQVLGYVNTQAEAAQRLLRAGETARATEQLRDMAEAAREVYADVREDVLGLRASLGERRDLVSTLREYLPRWQIQSGITAELVNSNTQENLARLAPGVDLQALRIIQEALSNTRKHGRAQRVWVNILDGPEGPRVTIEDDGVGFERDSVVEARPGHFGISVMRERAASIGADLTVESAPGRGTRVTLHMPVDSLHRANAGGLHAGADS